MIRQRSAKRVLRQENPYRKFRTTRDIVIPRGTTIVHITQMRQDVSQMAMAVVRAGPDKHFDFLMHFNDALELGWIEPV